PHGVGDAAQKRGFAASGIADQHQKPVLQRVMQQRRALSLAGLVRAGAVLHRYRCERRAERVGNRCTFWFPTFSPQKSMWLSLAPASPGNPKGWGRSSRTESRG